jgi:hypothetical protein
MSTVVVEYLLKNPELMKRLPNEMLEQILKVARAEQERLRGSNAMPESAVAACVAVVDDRLMADIVNDSRRSNDPGWLKAEGGKPVEKGTGWALLVPIGPDPSIKHIDRIAAHFDRMEKIDQAAKIAQAIGVVKAKEGE